jgi:hypothetical protein
MMETRPKHRKWRIFLSILGGLFGLCLLLSAISAVSNRDLPEADASDQLSDLDNARLLEAIHLRADLGNKIWPGFGEALIPVIVWNQAYEFLVGFQTTPPSDWAPVLDDSFNSQTYSRPADDPQNFAVPVGDAWAASIGSKSGTDAFLIRQFKEMFPPPIKQVFPYRLLIQPSETQIGGVLHEQFHVFQMQNAPERLESAEAAHLLGDRYESAAEAFGAEWKRESALLANALQAETESEKKDLVRQFLDQRDARRADSQHTPELIDYERWLEWEEGTAKYIEVASLKQAFETAGYIPTPAMAADPDFRGYKAFDRRWSQEMIQLRYVTTSGEQQFYMAGMAESFLLDDLLPGWKVQYWKEGIFLEDLLRLALKQ